MKSLVRITALATLVAVGLAFATSTRAEEKKKGPAPKQFTGIVESCDAGCIKVKKGEESKMFTVNAQTKVSVADKKEAAIADVKAGDKVVVLFAEDGGQAVAKRIMPAPAGKAKGKK